MMDCVVISRTQFKEIIRNLDEGKFSFFVSICECGDLTLCKECIDAGIDINITDKNTGRNAFMEAIFKEEISLEVANWFIDNSIDINVRDFTDMTALSYACMKGNYTIADFLLKKGAIIGYSDDYFDKYESDLMIAVKKGNSYEIVKLLLDTGFFERKKFELEKALSLAVRKGKTGCVKALLEYDVSANRTYDMGSTPLHNAVEINSYDIVKLLLEHGADVNALITNVRVNDGIFTPLDMVDNTTNPIHDLLVSYGAKKIPNEKKEEFYKEERYKPFNDLINQLKEFVDSAHI